MRLLFVVASVIVSVLIGGCTEVKTQVDAYSTIPQNIETRTVYVAPLQGMSANDLQWQANAQILALVLAEKGFSVVGSQRDAALTAYLGFGVDQGERVQEAYSVPQFGVTGYSGAQTYGSVYGSHYSATTTFTPTYGVTGYQTGVRSSVIYTRLLAIDMIDNRTRQQVFQGRGVSRGACGSFTAVAPQVIGAVLSNFPAGYNGTVSAQSDVDC